MHYLLQELARNFPSIAEWISEKLRKKEPPPPPPPRAWITPAGKLYPLYQDMAKQPHLLIAGATGSGKSVVLNGIITTLLYKAPPLASMILLDLKRVELAQYRNLPHVLQYASEPWQMAQALQYAINITEARYKYMAEQGERMYTGGDVYVMIDELADLMTTQAKTIRPLLQRICQIGRAARVHVIACTQCPLAVVIPTPIKVNFDARLGLRTRNAQDSRNILGMNGCEALPRYGRGYYMKPEGVELYSLPMIQDSEIERLCKWWKGPDCKMEG